MWSRPSTTSRTAAMPAAIGDFPLLFPLVAVSLGMCAESAASTSFDDDKVPLQGSRQAFLGATSMCLNPFMNQHSHLLVAVAVAAADASPCGPQLAPTRFRLHVLSLLRLPPARLRHAPTPSSPAPAPVRSVRLCSPRSSREPPALRLDPRHSRQLRRVMPSALRPLTGPFAPSR
jgi:hypothetical protein